MATRQPRMSPTTTAIVGAISDAVSDLETLKDELTDWYDGMPENLQGGSKGDALQEAVSELDNVSEPSLSNEVTALLDTEGAKVEITYQRDRKATSRSARRYESVSMLDAAKEKLEMLVEERRKVEAADTENDMTAHTDITDELEVLAGELNDIADCANSVEFPGMMG